MILFVTAFAIVIVKVPFTPLIDTFVLPLLFLLLLRDLDEKYIRILAFILAAILAVNACVALAEFATGWRLVTISVPEGVTADPTDPTAQFDWRAQLMQEWRASALLGHPLQNGVVVGCFVLCLAGAGSRWLPSIVRGPLMLLQIASLFAFGARTSLVSTLALIILIALYRLSLMAIDHQRVNLRKVALVFFLLPLAVVVVAYAWDSGFFARTIERFVDDSGSANTRLVMFDMFKPLSWNDLFFGPDQRDVATWQRVLGLEFGIESSWIGLILSYGIVMTSLVVAGLACFCVSLVRSAGRGAMLVLFAYLIVVSTAATLSGKTTTFAMVTILILLFLRPSANDAKLSQPSAAIVRQPPVRPALATPESTLW
jgi:hypothetical protein